LHLSAAPSSPRSRGIGVLLALAACLAACGSKDEPSASTEEPSAASVTETPRTLVVYSGRSEAIVAGLFERFEAETNIDLQLRYGDSAQIAAAILEEGERTRADVYFSQETTTLGLLAEQGRLRPLPEPILERVDARFRGKDGRWVGTSGRARVLVWHTGGDLTAESLPSLEDLTTPAWRGRFGWAPENASFQSFIAAMIELRGEEATKDWVRRAQANAPRAFPSNTPLVAAVGAGEIDVGLTNHYYLYRLRAEHGADFAAENHYYRNGAAESLINLSGVGILEGSERREVAEQFVAWLLSPAAQRYLTEQNHEFPTVSGVETPQQLPDIQSLNAPRVDYGKLGDLETAVRVLREAGALL